MSEQRMVNPTDLNKERMLETARNFTKDHPKFTVKFHDTWVGDTTLNNVIEIGHGATTSTVLIYNTGRYYVLDHFDGETRTKHNDVEVEYPGGAVVDALMEVVCWVAGDEWERSKDKILPYAQSQCQNCRKLWPDTELINPIPDLQQRVSPGEPMPSGVCPDCGALCQQLNQESE